jgi:arsenate reductase
MAEIWHNPRCTKSRAAVALLEARGYSANVVLYLETPPTKARLLEVIEELGGDAHALVRSKEAAFKELGLSKSSTNEELVAAMATHPSLIERPLVITDLGTRIGRPTEALDAIVKG